MTTNIKPQDFKENQTTIKQKQDTKTENKPYQNPATTFQADPKIQNIKYLMINLPTTLSHSKET